MLTPIAVSSNYSIGPRQHIWKKCHTDLLGGFEIDESCPAG